MTLRTAGARTPGVGSIARTMGIKHGLRGKLEVLMRVVDDSTPKYVAVLRLLMIWKQLPESDIARMLRTYFLVTGDFREMEEQGFLTCSFSGDEYLISPTIVGRLWLEQFPSGEQ